MRRPWSYQGDALAWHSGAGDAATLYKAPRAPTGWCSRLLPDGSPLAAGHNDSRDGVSSFYV